MKTTVLVALIAGVPVLGHASTIQLADLIMEDELRFECVAEADLELAFGAAGKAGRLPQTCIPDPCDHALTRDEFGFQIVGREVTDEEWDDYYSRYAEYCRSEIPPEPGDEIIETPVEFWEPYIPSETVFYDPPVWNPPGTSTPPVDWFPPQYDPPTWTPPVWTPPTWTPPDTTPPPVEIGEAPLPAGVILLLTGVIGLPLAKKWKIL